MATIKDVAREARVSVASVSRALNGQAGVTEQTQQRIREAATRLRYIPHGAARSLITRRTHTIGALLPDLHGEFFSELIRGIDLAARSRGLHLLVSSSHDDALEAAAAMRAMQGRVDGLLVMSPHADADFLRSNLPAGLPTVLMNTALEACPDYAALSIDNRGGTRLVMEHLLASGRRRIAFIRGPAANHDVAEREQAYREALAAHLPGAEAQVWPGDFSEQSGHAAGQALLAQASRPDAVFAANDMMAIGCMSALREAGVRVPDDIAVAGFDDVPMARYVTPALTTVRVRIAELGAQALGMLDEQLESAGPVPFAHHRVQVELMVRESTVRPGHAPHAKPKP
ncbi:LacI family transcriptional regulator [Frateuria sp. Soil773]|uniref:LacI family DNA-binding transcriptional regulator n=1 Tax=Frateuria sp. Soil773 TaxID=1736407 RepID=UPI0006FB6F09|nr:LacI family DNA-binding transcriptional regulator [Frateuria sp. Soil773]KRF01215.1 LacI family transcriptional regulator [Frateuria sp. Soil773]